MQKLHIARTPLCLAEDGYDPCCGVVSWSPTFSPKGPCWTGGLKDEGQEFFVENNRDPDDPACTFSSFNGGLNQLYDSHKL